MPAAARSRCSLGRWRGINDVVRMADTPPKLRMFAFALWERPEIQHSMPRQGSEIKLLINRSLRRRPNFPEVIGNVFTDVVPRLPFGRRTIDLGSQSWSIIFLQWR